MNNHTEKQSYLTQSDSVRARFEAIKQREVILEAKILEVTLNDSYQQGINWSGLSKSLGNRKESDQMAKSTYEKFSCEKLGKKTE